MSNHTTVVQSKPFCVQTINNNYTFQEA